MFIILISKNIIIENDIPERLYYSDLLYVRNLNNGSIIHDIDNNTNTNTNNDLLYGTTTFKYIINDNSKIYTLYEEKYNNITNLITSFEYLDINYDTHIRICGTIQIEICVGSYKDMISEN